MGTHLDNLYHTLLGIVALCREQVVICASSRGAPMDRPRPCGLCSSCSTLKSLQGILGRGWDRLRMVEPSTEEGLRTISSMEGQVEDALAISLPSDRNERENVAFGRNGDLVRLAEEICGTEIPRARGSRLDFEVGSSGKREMSIAVSSRMGGDNARCDCDNGTCHGCKLEMLKKDGFVYIVENESDSTFCEVLIPLTEKQTQRALRICHGLLVNPYRGTPYGEQIEEMVRSLT